MTQSRRFESSNGHRVWESVLKKAFRVPRSSSESTIVTLFVVGLLVGGDLVQPMLARADAEATPLPSFWAQPHLIPDWTGYRGRLEALQILADVAYTGDFMGNVHGGLARKSEYLGNLDMTLTWHTQALLGRDLGTLFVYGLYDHGGKPSTSVTDTQGIDNIEAPDSAKIFEAWWQESFFDGHGSALLGLYDVNSEFYSVDSAELFINSSFGIGPELANTGLNGPSIFPTTSLAGRIKIEPVQGLEFQTAILDGVPGDPGRPKGTRIQLSDGDGVFWIAELAHYQTRSNLQASSVRSAQRRRIGRTWSARPDVFRVAVGTWTYSTRQPNLSRSDPGGAVVKTRGHPGVYLIADLDATRLHPLAPEGLAVFLQLGFADGDVGQYAGYSGSGIKYTGLIPLRPQDEAGFGIAAAYNGGAFKHASRAQGQAPAVAEVAFEWTYLAYVTPWLSIQADLQYILNPGGLRDRPDGVVAGLRYVVNL